MKFRSKVRAGFTLVEIMIVVLIIGILLAIAIPNFVSARESSRAKACVGNLKQLDSASQQYAMDNKLAGSAALTAAQFTALAPTYIRTFPLCPEGGTYYQGVNLTLSPYCGISVGASGSGTGTQTGTDYQGTMSGATTNGRFYHGL